MDFHDMIQSLAVRNNNKIVMLVSDGIGGLPMTPGGKTELEAADTPHLDALAKVGVQGMSLPIKPGITPGSGPGHLGLFGYDPMTFVIGRGALEAAGIGFACGPNDVAVRCNFCTVGADGKITDRRAGRIPTEESAEVVKTLRAVKIPGVEIFVEPVKEHRFVVVFRGEGLGGNVADTDPQVTGALPLDPAAHDEAGQKTAEVAKEFFNQAKKILAVQPKANCLTMRGFAKRPNLPGYEELYKLKAAAIAVYPMYKGLASLVGMDLVGQPATLEEEVEVLHENYEKYDFFFVHFKYTDSRGEDGDFDAKVKMIEELDKAVPRIMELKPSCLVVTGDHSTPAKMASHSFHPVPTLIVSDLARTDACQAYSETESSRGGLGHFEAKYLMPQAMAHAGRLEKFGA
ncbi:MAG: 2,3-bisphosphoglycerate-independent phosphoglycerate mutase [Planctomycetaceae bacterium]|jgi:2,3-bisphosphoglycerate-independent phosphoglycerate mutase|nr:2,3-bisphosphoglycerate-independent phosphoglycerate mutase [Planctomycetaceae bacterium]